MRDDIVFADQAQRGLVCVVEPLTADLAVQVGNLLDGTEVVGSPLVVPHSREPGESLLCGFQLRGGLAPVTGVGNELAVGISEEGGYAHVDAGHAPRLGQGFGLCLLGSEHDVPALALALDGHGLDPADHRPVLVDLDVPDTLEPYAGHGVVRGGVPAAAVAVPGEIHRVEPVHAPKARVARRVAGLDPAEERGERLVETAQGGLLAGEGPPALTLRVERPDLFELRRLLPVLDTRLRRVPVGVTALLQRPVVEGAVIGQHLAERDRLAHGGPHEELVRPDHPPHPLPRRFP
ncbi:hypothetical protein SSPNP10_19130 [Streptomyces sp. NP10]|nr:hypothetical protein SSPNP10_19130 [Streptomyces sp. NP10]